MSSEQTSKTNPSQGRFRRGRKGRPVARCESSVIELVPGYEHTEPAR